jgi:acyl-coenzyme A synthetase/AMP-(fatty) acid ligase
VHINRWASETPDQIAIHMAGSGETVTFADLERASNQGAHFLRALGLKRGDRFAIWSTNNPRYLEIAFAMQRSGLYMCPIASKLTAPEAAFIVNDSASRILIIDASIGAQAEALARDITEFCPRLENAFSIRNDLPGMVRWETETAKMACPPISDQSTGQTMIYSSGTTGRPKGILRTLSQDPFDAPNTLTGMHSRIFGSKEGTVFVATAPLYHTGPLHFVLTELRLGATVLVFEKFDAEAVLEGIERFKAERGQFVPTMFARMLKLSEDVRARYDVSSLKLALHSAAPCPVAVKQAMIDWWGPVLFEIYGGTENAGSTMINSHEWLKKPGSVGKSAGGPIHVCGEDGAELPVGETGVVYFEGDADFGYLGDEVKTRDARHPQHPNWATFGDIGRIDDEGYLFLSDRKAFMIICGGVNIYPQEAENVITMHPKVADVAVFGIPDPDMGEQVKAVVQPAEGVSGDETLEAEIIAFCKSHLASLKCPKTIDFQAELPRDATGKMLKKQLRDSYWQVPAATV